jgi:hypothetical protein
MKDVQWSFGRPQENPAQQSPFFCLVFDTNSRPGIFKLISSFRLGLTALRTARLFRELVGNSYRCLQMRIRRLSVRDKFPDLPLTPGKLFGGDRPRNNS